MHIYIPTIHSELRILFHLLLKLKLNAFTFIFFTLFGTHTQEYGSSVVFITSSTTFINADYQWIKKSFIRAYIKKCWSTLQGQFFRDMHFICPSDLEAQDSPKRAVVKSLDNPIGIFQSNQNIILYRVF